MSAKNFEERLKQYANEFHPVVSFEKGDRLLLMDFTDKNEELTDAILADTELFTIYINAKLEAANAKYGIGGYNEHRTIYSRSKVFDTAHPDLPEGKATNAQPLPDENVLQQDDHSVGEFYWEADTINYSLLKNFVAEHRSKPTQAEDFLWQQLRGKKLEGYKFRRQHIIGNFIADFVCLSKRVIIEVDGLIHQLPENKMSDEARTIWLRTKDYEVIRFTNEQVLFDTQKTLNKILQTLSEASPPPKKIYERSHDQLSTRKEKSIDSLPPLTPPTGENRTQTQLKQESNYLSATPKSEACAADSSPVGGNHGLGTQFGMGAEMAGQPEPRRLHLGIDIWGKPHTKVMAPLNGIVHSFAFNNAFGDYGATIILTHQLDGKTFHTLYGHLSLNSIRNLQEGDSIKKGDVIAEFGIPFENGNWPPHLHFQVIENMDRAKGDYPGVCKFSERESYLSNCPDPDLILGMMQYAKS